MDRATCLIATRCVEVPSYDNKEEKERISDQDDDCQGSGDNGPGPITFQKAINGPDKVHWRKAMRAELESMQFRGIFLAAKLPRNQRAIGTKWVFKIKRK